ncbi:MAG: DUF983 domain-containing protein [Parvibaculum sp.]|nr:DUF983 domain-containing protein [Parvibaculum sp.]
MSQVLDADAPKIYEARDGASRVGAPRSLWTSMVHGLKLRCPACGKGKLFRKYLKVNDTCPHCGEELFHHEADDAPPYFTILIVGHIVVPLMLAVEMEYMPAIWIHIAIWPLLTLGLCLGLLPRVKGAVVGVQWAAKMHDFADKDDA